VAEGTLLITGELSASTELVTVQAAATLGGNGLIARPIDVLGTLSPGDGPGILELASSLTFSARSELRLELSGPAPGDGPGFYDQVNMTSVMAGVSLDSTTTLSFSLMNGYVPADDSNYFLLTRNDTASFTETFAGLPEGATVNLGGRYSGVITYQANWSGTPEGSSITGGNDLALIHVVPEPGSAVLMLHGLVALAVVRRRMKTEL
jgi:hypothetical protein